MQYENSSLINSCQQMPISPSYQHLPLPAKWIHGIIEIPREMPANPPPNKSNLHFLFVSQFYTIFFSLV